MAKTLELRTVPAYDRSWAIYVNVGTNPKTKVNSKSWLAFEPFFSADTVGDFADAHGKGWRAEIEWCVGRGFVTLLDPTGDESETDVDETGETEEELADAE